MSGLVSTTTEGAGGPRILFFSAYARWVYHTALEATWAHALRLRGADVRFVLCNGLSNACDIHRENLNPRTPLACLDCQGVTATRLANYATPYEWLGNYLPHRVRAEAAEWVRAIPRDRLLEATWKELPVGEWAAASCYTQFRTTELEVRDPKVERIVRDFLVGTVVFAEATDALLEDQQPDTLVLLNGRFFPHWTAIELAQRRGIRFVTHERGLRRDTIRFAAGHRLHDLATNERLWDLWRDVPLNELELRQATKILEERRQGRNFSRLSFSPPHQDCAAVRAALELDERPIVAVFNSSDDETAAFPERRAGAFPRSDDFLPAVVELARGMPEVQFVLRMHPNIDKAEVGPNANALDHAREIAARAPENVRVVHPSDDISSYSLIDLAQVGIVYTSTIGLELAAVGKPVLCVARATYSHTDCVRQVDAPEELEPRLREALERDPSVEVARTALRWTYRYFREYAIPFDLVREEPEYEVSLAYSDVEPLMPGAHAVLDATCALLAGDTTSLFDDPSVSERARTSADEDRLISRWLQRILLRGKGPAPTLA